MPKDLFSKGPSPELVARVTGASRKSLPPGVSGTPPLPAGKPITSEGLTKEEQAALAAVDGWEIVDTKTVAAPRLTAGMPEPTAQAPQPVVPETIPGLAAAMATAEKSINEAAVALPAALTDTGIPTGPLYCEHCGHDQRVPDVPEPPHEEKMTFLHAFLGGIPYVKEVELFGGKAKVTFRTLTVGELETIFRQADYDKRAGKFNDSEALYYEQINRYRMILQIRRYQDPAPGGFDHDLNDGYSKATNPSASAPYVGPEITFADGLTGLPEIEKHVVDTVLKTEAVFRVIGVACNHFNRLAAKLEAMADNSDFWKPTGLPS